MWKGKKKKEEWKDERPEKKEEKTYEQSESVRPQKRRDRITTKYHGKEEAE